MPPPAVQQKARQLSQGNASLALELVGFDAELKAAMQYVFGTSFVCQVSPSSWSELTDPTTHTFDVNHVYD